MVGVSGDAEEANLDYCPLLFASLTIVLCQTKLHLHFTNNFAII
jgi:hypothetical protein